MVERGLSGPTSRRRRGQPDCRRGRSPAPRPACTVSRVVAEVGAISRRSNSARESSIFQPQPSPLLSSSHCFDERGWHPNGESIAVWTIGAPSKSKRNAQLRAHQELVVEQRSVLFAEVQMPDDRLRASPLDGAQCGVGGTRGEVDPERD